MRRAPRPTATSRRRVRVLLWVALGLLVVDGAVLLLMRSRRRPPRTVDMAALREGFTARLDGAARGPFLVTGTVYVTGTARVRRRDLPVGAGDRVAVAHDTVTVRVRGQVTYGFDITQLPRDSIRREPYGTILVAMPPLRPGSAKVYVRDLEMMTRAGWLRIGQPGQTLPAGVGAVLDSALRERARAFIASSDRPRKYTAHLLEGLLAPAAIAAGEPHPRLRFRFAGAAQETGG